MQILQTAPLPNLLFDTFSHLPCKQKTIITTTPSVPQKLPFSTKLVHFLFLESPNDAAAFDVIDFHALHHHWLYESLRHRIHSEFVRSAGFLDELLDRLIIHTFRRLELTASNLRRNSIQAITSLIY